MTKAFQTIVIKSDIPNKKMTVFISIYNSDVRVLRAVRRDQEQNTGIRHERKYTFSYLWPTQDMS